MTIQDYYEEAIENGHHSLVLLIEYLVYERKVRKMTDDEEWLHYYLQDKFHLYMNKYLTEYAETERKVNS